MTSTRLDQNALAAARLWAAHAAPYLASAIFAMSPSPLPGLKTMGTDRHWHLFIDPDLFARWTVEEMGAVLIHETHHLLRDHADRAIALGVGPTDSGRFNVAADLEINDDLRDIPLPVGRLDPDDFGLPSGELAESYYVLLEGRDIPAVDCGSGAHGVIRPWDRLADDRAVDDVEADLIRQQVAMDTRAAVQAGGHVPNGLERWANAFLRPRVDWRREFAAHVRSGTDAIAGAIDYSYRRPSRRTGSPIGRAVVLPALVQPVPRIAVVVDTSASMASEDLDQALAEISGILRASGIGRNRLTVLSCDTSVRTSQSVFTAAQVRLEGGGGTNMGVGIDQACRLRPSPGVVVVVTDGYTPWPAERPAVTVVVALLGHGPDPPPWARIVRVPDARAQQGPS